MATLGKSFKPKMTGLTFKQILKNCDYKRIQKSAYVVVRNIRLGISKSTNMPRAVSRTYSKESSHPKAGYTRYSTFIEFWPKQQVRVSCSCEDFCFTWEMALIKNHASYLTYSNGELPKEKNPQMLGGCCKHVIALHRALQENQQLPG